MLFDKDIRPVCALCENGSPIDEETVLCHSKGPVPCDGSCRRFRYDPLKRVPARPAVMKSFSEKDFEL